MVVGGGGGGGSVSLPLTGARFTGSGVEVVDIMEGGKGLRGFHPLTVPSRGFPTHPLTPTPSYTHT